MTNQYTLVLLFELEECLNKPKGERLARAFCVNFAPEEKFYHIYIVCIKWDTVEILHKMRRCALMMNVKKIILEEYLDKLKNEYI